MSTSSQWVALGVPIDCVGKPGGTELSPEALRRAGITKALNAEDLGDLPVRIDSPQRDPESGIVGYKSVCHATRTIRTYVGSVLHKGHRVFLLGGCCTQMMGALAGARDEFGRVGVAWADGHLDLYEGHTSPTGEAADMALATLLGHGPRELLEAIGPGAVLAPADVALLGYRDSLEAAQRGSLLPSDLGPALVHFDADFVRSWGAESVGSLVSERLATDAGRFWLHIDVDVLEMQVFPATDYLMPGGLTWNDLETLLTPIGRSPGLIGASVACYNPEKDAEGASGRRVIQGLVEILGKADIRTGLLKADGCS